MPATYTKSAGASQQEQNNNNNNAGSGGNERQGGRAAQSAKFAAASRAATSGSASQQQQQSSFEEPKRCDSIQSGGGGIGCGDQDSLNSCTNSEENRSLNNNSNAEYDHIRNTTLMFFLDRLFIASKEGKGPRTLHDLSCLFGKREFTKEMRQIVGASRNGLKKFLQSYPSLFTIEGDNVYLTQLQQDPTNPSVRDYNREAIEYFAKKLQQFGSSLVPIRNLFGYRSQASQEVRHISGKSIKEFKEFLAANSDSFEMLADEHVVLKSVIEEFESRGESYSLAQQLQQTAPGEEAVMDPYLNKQFAHYIEELMKKMSPQDESDEARRRRRRRSSQEEEEAGATTTTTEENNDSQHKKEEQEGAAQFSIEFLHEKVLQDCKNQLFLKMVETLDEFRVFLRMHPKIFKRFKRLASDNNSGEREFVRLLSEEERKEFEAQAYPSISRQQSTLRRSDTCESNLSGHSSSNSIHHSQNHNQQQHVSEQPMSMIEPSLAAKASLSLASSSSRKPSSRANLAADGWCDQASESRRPTLSRQATASSNNSLNNGESSSLRAAAPPFVPKQQQQPAAAEANVEQQQRCNKQQQQQDNTWQKHQALVGSCPAATATTAAAAADGGGGGGGGSATQQTTGRGIIDPRQAIRSYLTKASASNSASSGLYAPSKQSNGGAGQQAAAAATPTRSPSATATTVAATAATAAAAAIVNHKPLSRQSSSANVDDLRARTVSIVREASNIITRIINTTDAVAFDCKGYNLGFNGQISLILFGFIPNSASDCIGGGGGAKAILAETHNKNNANGGNAASGANGNCRTGSSGQKPEVCIFDLITNPELAYCLKPLLESDKVVKVVHDVRNKSNALFVQFDIVLNNVFDTQVANLVIQQQETGKPAYMSRYISMGKLCEVYGDEALEKYRNLIRSKTRHSSANNNNNNSSSYNNNNSNQFANENQAKFKDVNYWRTRPLTEPMVYESTMDVYSLLSGVYQSLKSRIKPEYEPLCRQLNDEGVLARIKPDEIRSIKKERKIELEVIALKSKLYNDSTGFIVLSNREIRLLRHIEMTDEVRKKIQQCKKVAKKLERLDMKQAQQNQLLNESMNSQSSSGGSSSSNGVGVGVGAGAGDNQQSLDHLNSDHSEDSANIGSQHSQQQRQRLQQGQTSQPDQSNNNSDSLGADEDGCAMMSNLMDSSMFDELKDKMIESSSLLESLEDDDDDAAAAAEHSSQAHLHHNASHSHHQHGDDSCRCQCHRKTSTTSTSTPSAAAAAATTTTTRSSTDLGVASDDNKLEEQEQPSNGKSSLKSSASSLSLGAKSDKSDENSSVESRVADMAVQCDLLS